MNKFAKILLLLLPLLFLLTVGYRHFFSGTGSLISGQAESSLNHLEKGENFTLVILGDSITAGTNSPTNYTKLLNEQLSLFYPMATLQVINAGVPGNTASMGLARLDSDVLAHHPDAVIIQFGWNDMKDGVKADVFNENIRSIVDQLQAATVRDIILLTTTQVDVSLANWKIRPFNKIIRSTAQEKGCILVDLFLAFQKEIQKGTTSITSLMSNDHIHPSETGHQLLLRTILPVFQRSNTPAN